MQIAEIIGYIVVLFVIYIFVNSITSEPKHKKGEIFKVKEKKRLSNNDIIKELDKNFDEQEFLNFSKNIFIKYQRCLKENNIELIKHFSTEEFLKNKEEEIAKNKKIDFNAKNRREIEFLGIKFVEVYSYNKINNEDIMNVKISYNTNIHEYSVVTGNRIRTYKDKTFIKYMQFKRVKEIQNSKEIVSTNCLHCGAPTDVISIGKCPYCGAITHKEELEWKLNDIKNSVR